MAPGFEFSSDSLQSQGRKTGSVFFCYGLQDIVYSPPLAQALYHCCYYLLIIYPPYHISTPLNTLYIFHANTKRAVCNTGALPVCLYRFFYSSWALPGRKWVLFIFPPPLSQITWLRNTSCRNRRRWCYGVLLCWVTRRGVW